jgi:nicotinamidase/pyrazinamidase
MQFNPDDALIVVDLQQDFFSGGSLPVAEAESIVPAVNELIEGAVDAGAMVVASRDWHPKRHISFHACGGPWPEHCVQYSPGARFHAALRLPSKVLLISKGADPDKDQHSVFAGSGLADELRRRGIHRVVVCGVALDVCVRETALDAIREGFRTVVLSQASRPLTQAGFERAMSELKRSGVIAE